MHRRFFLQLLGAMGVAVVAAPKTVVARALVVPEVLPPLTSTTGLQTISIVLPDGSTWTMRGYVRTQMVNAIDGLVQSKVEFKPYGPCEITESERRVIDEVIRCSKHPKYKGRRIPIRNHCADCKRVYEQRHRAMPVDGTTITLDGKTLGDVQEVSLPSMHRESIEVTRNGMFGGPPDENRVYVPGILRMGPLTFTVNYGEPLIK